MLERHDTVANADKGEAAYSLVSGVKFACTVRAPFDQLWRLWPFTHGKHARPDLVQPDHVSNDKLAGSVTENSRACFLFSSLGQTFCIIFLAPTIIWPLPHPDRPVDSMPSLLGEQSCRNISMICPLIAIIRDFVCAHLALDVNCI